MKTFSALLLAVALTIPAFAEEAKPAVPEVKPAGSAEIQTPGHSFSVSAGVISAPFILTNGYIFQKEQNDIATDGKAIYAFTIATTGEYIIKGMANAPDDGANSFYVNVDAQPEDPLMIWDITPTSGFEERVVNWRGNGSADDDEFSPKRFKLEPGAHKLIIVGREAETQLKSLTIEPAPAAPAKETPAK